MKDGVAHAVEQECGLSDIVEDVDSWDTLTSLASHVEQTALKDLSSRSMDFIVDGLPPSGVSVESVSVVENQVDAPSDVITRPELLLDSYASTASAQASLLAFQDEVEAEPSYASVEVPSSKGVKAAVIQVPSSVYDRSSQVRSNTSADNTDTYDTGQWIVECDACEATSSSPTAIRNGYSNLRELLLYCSLHCWADFDLKYTLIDIQRALWVYQGINQFYLRKNISSTNLNQV